MKTPFAPFQSPGIRRSPGGGIAISLYAAALCVTACLQTDPGQDPIENVKVSPPEDNGRRAGATSTTNWPPEIVGGKVHQLQWKVDSVLKLSFIDMSDSLGGPNLSVERGGFLRLYLGSSIPSMDTAASIEFEFPSTKELQVPFQWIDSLTLGREDTASFNLRLDSDTLQGWIYGFHYSRIKRLIVQTVSSPFPANTTQLTTPKHFFHGSVEQVASMLPIPAGNNSKLSFYIPGTPNFYTAQSDSFMVGPFSKGRYPLRVIRTSDGGGIPQGTLVEAWELLVTVVGSKSTFKLGEQVLAHQSQAKVTLREN